MRMHEIESSVAHVGEEAHALYMYIEDLRTRKLEEYSTVLAWIDYRLKDLKLEIVRRRIALSSIANIQKVYHAESLFFRIRHFGAQRVPVSKCGFMLDMGERHISRITDMVAAMRNRESWIK